MPLIKNSGDRTYILAHIDEQHQKSANNSVKVRSFEKKFTSSPIKYPVTAVDMNVNAFTTGDAIDTGSFDRRNKNTCMKKRVANCKSYF
jgi:hypothetical protein